MRILVICHAIFPLAVKVSNIKAKLDIMIINAYVNETYATWI